MVVLYQASVKLSDRHEISAAQAVPADAKQTAFFKAAPSHHGMLNGRVDDAAIDEYTVCKLTAADLAAFQYTAVKYTLHVFHTVEHFCVHGDFLDRLILAIRLHNNTLFSGPVFAVSEKRNAAFFRKLHFFFGGERGIRTLERVLTVTRFPIVRLRPAQPSLHGARLFVAVRRSNKTYYNRFSERVKSFFEIF